MNKTYWVRTQFFIALCVFSSFLANADSFSWKTTVTTGNWNDAASWDKTSGAGAQTWPGVGDDVTFPTGQGTTLITINGSYPASINNLTVTSGTIRLTADLTVNGTTTFNGVGVAKNTAATGFVLGGNGTGVLDISNITLTLNHDIVFPAGLTNQGPYLLVPNTTSGNTTNLIINPRQGAASATSITGLASNDNVLFGTAAGTGTPVINNLQLDREGNALNLGRDQTSIAAATAVHARLIINGNYTINNGVVNTANFILTVNGNTVVGKADGTSVSACAGDYAQVANAELNTFNNVQVNNNGLLRSHAESAGAGSGQASAIVITGNLEINNGGNVSINGTTGTGTNFTVNGTTTINSGGNLVDRFASGVTTFKGLVTLEAGAKWGNAFSWPRGAGQGSYAFNSVTHATTGAHPPLVFEGGLVVNTAAANVVGGNGQYTFQTNSQTISGTETFTIGTGLLSFNPGSGNTITINNTIRNNGNASVSSGTVVLGTAGTIARTVSGGTFTVNTGVKLQIGSNTASAFPANYSSQTLTGSTVEYLGGVSQTMSAGISYSNLIVSGTVGMAGNVTVGNTFTVTSAGTLSGSSTLTISGNSLVNNGNINFTGGSLAFNNTSAATTVSGSPTSFNVNSISVNSGAGVTFSVPSINVTGTITTAGAGQGGVTLLLPATTNITGAATSIAGTYGTGTVTAQNLIIANTPATLTFNQAGNFRITGSFTNNSTAGTAVTSNSGSAVLFAGNSTQQVTNATTSAFNFRGVTVNAGSTIDLTGNFNVIGVFTNNGTVTANSGQVWIGSGNGVGGGSFVSTQAPSATQFYDVKFGNQNNTTTINGSFSATGTFYSSTSGTGSTVSVLNNNPLTFNVVNADMGVTAISPSATGTNVTHTLNVSGNLVVQTGTLNWLNSTNRIDLVFNGTGTQNWTFSISSGNATPSFCNVTFAHSGTLNLLWGGSETQYQKITGNVVHSGSGNVLSASANANGRINFCGGTAQTISGASTGVTEFPSFYVDVINTVLTLQRPISINGQNSSSTGRSYMRTFNIVNVGTGATRPLFDLNGQTLTYGGSEWEAQAGTDRVVLTGTVIFRNNGATPVLQGGFTFDNVTLETNISSSGSRTHTFNGTVDAGTYSLVNTGASVVFNINGTFRTANTNGFSGGTSTAISTSTNAPAINLGASSTVEYYSSSPQTVTAFAAGYRNLSITGSGIKNLAASTSIQGGSTLTVASGATFNSGSFVLSQTGTGTAAVVVNGTWQTANTAGFSGTTTSAVNSTSTSVALNVGSTVEYNASVAQVLSGRSDYSNLTTSDGATRTLNGAVDVANVLTMTAGNIDLGNFDLTLGNSASNTGTLTFTDGFIITSGTGRFVRWFGTSGLPTAASGTAGLYPLGTASANRNVYLFFDNSSALSSGGSIGLNHNSAAGATAVTSFADGGVTIEKRTNAGWTFTTPSAPALTGSISLQVQGNTTLAPAIVADIRLVRATDAVGTAQPGTGSTTAPQAGRTGLSLADLANTFYIGSTDINFQPLIVAIATGNWSNTGTWAGGVVPTIADNVYIPNPYTVALTANASAKSLTTDNGSILNASTFSLSFPTGGTAVINGEVQTANTNGFNRAASSSISTTNSPVVTLGATSTVNYNSSGTQTLDNRQYANLTTSNGSSTRIIDGNVSISGTFSRGSNLFTMTGSTVTFNSGTSSPRQAIATGSYFNLAFDNFEKTLPSGIVTINGTFSPGSATHVITGNTINYAAATGSPSPQPVTAWQYQNLTFDNNPKQLPNGSTIYVAGTFSPGAGTGHTITGSTIELNGSGGQTVPAFNYNNLAVGSRASGTITLNSGVIGIAGSLTLPSNLTYNQSAIGYNATTVTSLGTVIDYNGTGAQTISPLPSPAAYNVLRISGTNRTGDVTLSGSISIGGTLATSFKGTMPRMFDPQATFSTGFGYVTAGSTVSYSGTGGTFQFITGGFPYYHLDTPNQSRVLDTINTIYVAGNFTASGYTIRSVSRNFSFEFNGTGSQNVYMHVTPANLTFSGGGTKAITGSFSVRDQLTLNGGNINLGGNVLTLGTSAAAPGTLVHSSGHFITSNNVNGGFERWFGTSGLPVSASNAGLFPVGTTIDNRSLWLIFSSPTAFTTGGTVRVTGSLATTGTNTVTPFLDGGITITRRTSSTWGVTTPTAPVLDAGATITLSLQGTGAYTPTIVANTRVILGAGTAAGGTSLAGSGTLADPISSRQFSSLAQLTQTFAVGIDAAVIPAIASGTWNTPGNWSGNAVPSSTDIVNIPSGISLTLTSDVSVQALILAEGGTLVTGTQAVTTGVGGYANIDGTIRLSNASGLNQNTSSAISTANTPTVTLGSNSTVEYNSGSSQTIDNLNYANLNLGTFGTRTINGSVGISGTFTPGTGISYSGSPVITFNGGAGQVVPATTYPTLTLNNTSKTFGSGTVNITTAFNPGTASHVQSSTTFSFSSTASIGAMSGGYNNLTIASGTPALASNVAVISTLTIGSGATLSQGSNDLSVYGNVSNAGTISGAGTLSLTGGTGNHTLSGNGTYGNLTLDNAGRTANVTGSPTVTGRLNLVNGMLTVQSSESLNLGSSALFNESSTAYLTGALSTTRNLTATGSQYNFAGDGSNSGIGLRLTATNALGNTTITRVTGSELSSNSGMNSNTAKRYFTLTPTNNTNLGVNLVVSYFDHELVTSVGTLSPANLAIYKAPSSPFNPANPGWKKFASTPDPATNTVALNGNTINSFSIITLGDEIDFPLPVSLVKFEARKVASNAHLTWQTASEQNADHFVVERAIDNGKFKAIGTVKAAGNSVEMRDYAFTDESALKLAGSSLTYRLNQVDVDGKYTHYGPSTLALTGTETGVAVVQNPFASSLKLRLANLQDQPVAGRLLDAMGREVHRFEVKGTAPVEQLELSNLPQLAPGTYVLSLNAGGQTFTINLVKHP